MPQPANPYLSDPDWLRDRYTNRGWTQAEIAGYIDTTQSAVSKALKRHRIPAGVRPDNLLWDDEWLRAARVDRGLSTKEIAAEVGRAPSTVVYHLHRVGLSPTRG